MVLIQWKPQTDIFSWDPCAWGCCSSSAKSCPPGQPLTKCSLMPLLQNQSWQL